GAKIVLRSLEEPLRQIVGNAGGEGSVVIAKVLSEKQNVGYNAETGAYEDLVASGVIDPAKVVRSAIQNAASVAGLALTTETLITDIPEKKDAHAGGAPGMGGMGGMGGGMDY
ncbi:MAG TPA: TCP-1/cpn60 chaperonin family protein, partial [bacterium]|nr:TCP-1/cpn60 chaperonin family protein [bacterium]